LTISKGYIFILAQISQKNVGMQVDHSGHFGPRSLRSWDQTGHPIQSLIASSRSLDTSVVRTELTATLVLSKPSLSQCYLYSVKYLLNLKWSLPFLSQAAEWIVKRSVDHGEWHFNWLVSGRHNLTEIQGPMGTQKKTHEILRHLGTQKVQIYA